jgi:hypothetical protein
MIWQPIRQHRKAIGITLVAAAAIAAFGSFSGAVRADESTASAETSSSTSSVSVITPPAGSVFDGSKQIEVSAYYHDASSGGITRVEILIDGQSAATKNLDKAEARGVISFLIDPATLDGGTHKIVIRATSASGSTFVARTSFKYKLPESAVATQTYAGDDAGVVTLLSPKANEKVSGIVSIKVKAVDPSGKNPFVSLAIDNIFKSLRNDPPYVFDWDTTRLSNGWHTVEISGFNSDTLFAKTGPIRVYVNNSGGDTPIDHSLLDTVIGSASPSSTSASTTPAVPAHAATSNHPAENVTTPAAGTASLASRASLRTANRLLETTSLKGFDLVSIDSAPQRVSAHALAAPTVKKYVKPVPSAQLAVRSAAVNLPANSHSVLIRDAFSFSSVSTVAKLSAPKALKSYTVASAKIDASEIGEPTPIVRASSPMAPIADASVMKNVVSHVKPVHVASAKIAPAVAPAVKAEPILDKFRAIPHDSVVVAPPKSGVFSSHVRHILRGQYYVMLNNHKVSFDQPIQDHRDCLCAPIRQIFESEGGMLEWSSKNQQVKAVTASKEVTLQIGSKTAVVNDKQTKLTVAPYLKGGRTMIPVGFLPIALDVTVSYDATTGHLEINSKN